MRALSGKPKKCSVCPTRFIPARPFQTWCSPECGLEVVKKNKAKERRLEASRMRAENKAHREAKERVKTKGEHAKEAQAAFNAFIRKRDELLPCVSCGRHHQGQYHAGHFRSVGSCPELRFEPLNVHKQCAPCNNHKSGNVIEYRIELVRRIGLEDVEWLEGKHEPKRYTIDDLKAIKAEYRKKLRELDSQRLP